jgi:hypothetical protein
VREAVNRAVATENAHSRWQLKPFIGANGFTSTQSDRVGGAGRLLKFFRDAGIHIAKLRDSTVLSATVLRGYLPQALYVQLSRSRSSAPNER